MEYDYPIPEQPYDYSGGEEEETQSSSYSESTGTMLPLTQLLTVSSTEYWSNKYQSMIIDDNYDYFDSYDLSRIDWTNSSKS